jgi:hypothetical protein
MLKNCDTLAMLLKMRRASAKRSLAFVVHLLHPQESSRSVTLRSR